jgi:uncharacterized protein GlcG (DUF336 family)
MKFATMVALMGCAGASLSGDDHGNGNCRDLPSEAQLRTYMQSSAGASAGGLFEGRRMWAAVVNRDGELCGWTTSTTDVRQVWPGSQAIAKAKAYTANAFSLDDFALSTARLYTFTQPGHSLWSLGQANVFDPKDLLAPGDESPGRNQIAGGMIFFGGGLPLYRNGKIVGGLGISGDTSCTDHEIAKRVRALANLAPTHLPGGNLADDIILSPPDAPSVFAHPLCLNTWRNGVSLGTERPATYDQTSQ